MQAAIRNMSQTSFARRLQELAEIYSLNFRVGNDGTWPVVCVCDSYLDPGFEAWNRHALEAGIVWIPVWANWTNPWVGPVLGPNLLCHACIAKRLRENVQIDNFISAFHREHRPFRRPRAESSGLSQAAPAFVLAQLVQGLSDPGSHLRRHILTFDFVAGEVAAHRTLKRPQCPVCGPDEPAQQTEVALEDNLYAYCYGGERRNCPPSQTWELYKHHISPVTGVVSSFVSKAGPKHGHLHSYAAGHAFPVKQGDLATLKGNMRHRSGGKGALDIQARVGALCEAVERYSGIVSGEEDFVHASFYELEDAIHVNEITLYSDQQYNNREAWNQQCVVDFQLIPHRFEKEAAIDWCRVWSLEHGRSRLVPAAYCYYGHADLQRFFCACDSNGCAAGNTLEEAIVRGFMELVERDAVAIWWYNRTRQPQVDIHSFQDSYLDLMLKEFAQSCRSLWAIDLTTDLGIPAIAAVSHRKDHPTEDIIIGFSADLDPKTALLRAVNEVGQFIPALSHRDSKGNTIYYYEDKCAIDWWKSGIISAHPYLLPDSDRILTMGDYHNAKRQSQKAEVEFCMERASVCGLDILVLNQTRPDIGLPVAKVIVPGMRHFWNRLAPGRLYDVPVALGRLEATTVPENLNPIPMFF